MKKLFGIATMIAISASLVGCNSMGARYNASYEGYNISYMDCIDNDKHVVSFTPDGATAPVELKLAAGNCDRIAAPDHELEYIGPIVSNLGSALIGAAATVYRVKKDASTRTALAREDRLRDEAQYVAFIETTRNNGNEQLGAVINELIGKFPTLSEPESESPGAVDAGFPELSEEFE